MPSGFDALTGLLDRATFRRKLGALEVGGAVIVLDVDRFVRVEEALGTAGGDRLLATLAERLKSVAPPGSDLGRIGDDDFGLLLQAPAHDAVLVAEDMRLALTEPLEIDGYELVPGMTAGVAVLEDGDPADVLLGRATAALARARKTGRRMGVAGPRPIAGGTSDLALECALRGAMDRGEIELVWQPIAAMPSLELVGFEALMRWTHPTWGAVSPARFIPIAEETGLIVALGAWAAEVASERVVAWSRLDPDGTPPFVTVNVSSRQVFAPGFVEGFRALARRPGVRAGSLVIELTESTVVDEPERAARTLTQLKNDGFRLAIDDFGTGHSSLGQLHRFPFDILKVDRSFVAAMCASQQARTVISSTIQLAHALGLDVVAEGVETVDELARLGALQCDKAQGFYLSRPLPDADAQRVLRSGGGRLLRPARRLVAA